MSTRAYIAGLFGLMVKGLILGFGVIAVLSVPALSAHAAILIPTVAAIAFFGAPLLFWYIAPRLRPRYWHARGLQTRAGFA